MVNDTMYNLFTMKPSIFNESDKLAEGLNNSLMIEYLRIAAVNTSL